MADPADLATTGLADIETIVLAGGLGTRLRSVLPDTPKLLAPVGGRPFIEVLLDDLETQGIRRVTFSLGHLSDQVLAHLAAHPRGSMRIETVVETEQLGTGGAIGYAIRERGLAEAAAPVLVMNGDTYLEADLADFLAAAIAHEGSVCALLAVCVNDVADYGSLKRRADGCIEAFLEKGATGPGLVSAGVYVFKPALLKRLADIDKGSLERDVFPDLAASAIFCHVVEGRFIDIGTPERLSGFQDMTDQ